MKYYLRVEELRRKMKDRVEKKGGEGVEKKVEKNPKCTEISYKVWL